MQHFSNKPPALTGDLLSIIVGKPYNVAHMSRYIVQSTGTKQCISNRSIGK